MVALRFMQVNRKRLEYFESHTRYNPMIDIIKEDRSLLYAMDAIQTHENRTLAQVIGT